MIRPTVFSNNNNTNTNTTNNNNTRRKYCLATVLAAANNEYDVHDLTRNIRNVMNTDCADIYHCKHTTV